MKSQRNKSFENLLDFFSENYCLIVSKKFYDLRNFFGDKKKHLIIKVFYLLFVKGNWGIKEMF